MGLPFKMVTAIALALVFSNVHAQTALPINYTIEGRLFDTAPTPAPINSSVDLQLELIDPNAPTCIIYREVHTGIDVSSTDSLLQGRFAVKMGAGDTVNFGLSNFTNAFGGRTVNGDVNGDNVYDGTDAAASCLRSVTPGANLQVRISVKPAGGGAFGAALVPNTVITSVPQSLAAETLQGYAPNAFLKMNATAPIDLSQSNIENVFSVTNYAKLLDLLNGSSTQYLQSSGSNAMGGSLNMGNHTINGVAAPALGTDATNKTYVDGNLAGSSLNTTGLVSGNTLIWNGSAWTVGTPTALDNTKLPLAGGTMSGPITMGANDIYNTGHITVGNQRMITLGRYNNAQEGGLALTGTDEGRMFYNTDTDQLRVWNGSAYIPFDSGSPTGLAGGDLSGTYPNPLLNVGTVTTAKLANDAVTAEKMDNAGAGINRIVMSDSVNPQLLRFRTCALNQILQWGGTGWACVDVGNALPTTGIAAGMYGSSSTVSRIGLSASGVVTSATDVAIDFPVVSVNGKTGVVVLNGADIGLGSASLEDVGNGANEIPMTDAGGKLNPSVIPILGIGDITGAITQIVASGPIIGGGSSGVVSIGLDTSNLDAARIRGFNISTATPTPGQVLKFNASGGWQPDTDAGGAGFVTTIQANAPLTGGGSFSTITIGVDVGTTTGQLVAVAAGNKLPVIDGSDLTNIANLRGANISTTTPTSNQVLQYNGSAWEAATLTDNGIVSLSGINGALVTGPATVKTIGIDTGVNAGQIVQVAAGNKLPVIDGSDLTNISNLRGYNISTTIPTSNQVLKYNGSAWEAAPDFDGDITEVQTGTGLVGGGSIGGLTISVATIPHNTILANTSGSTLTPSSRTLTQFLDSAAGATNGSVLIRTGGNWTALGPGTNGHFLQQGVGTAQWAEAGTVSFIAMGSGLVSGNIISTGTVNLDVGVGPNQIVQLDGSSRLPTVDGRAVTNISNLRGYNVGTNVPLTDQVLKFNGTGWAPATDLGASSGVAGAIQFSGGAGALTSDDANFFYNNATDSLGVGTNNPQYPVDVQRSAPGVGSQIYVRNTSAAGSSLAGISFANDLSDSIGASVMYGGSGTSSTYANRLVLEGSSLGVSVLSSSATGDVKFYTGGDTPANERMRVTASGNVGIGTTAPIISAVLDVYGTGNLSAMVVPRETTSNRPVAGQNGMIRYNTSLAKFEVYEDNAWKNMIQSASGASSLSDITAASSINSIDNGGNAQVWNWNSLTTNTGLTLQTSSVTTGTVLKVESSFSSASNTGAVAQFNVSGGASNAIPIFVTNAGAGASFRVDDANSDPTPFVIDNAGQVGVGTSNPVELVTVRGQGNTDATVLVQQTDAGSAAEGRVMVANDLANWFSMGIGSSSHSTTVKQSRGYLETGPSGFGFSLIANGANGDIRMFTNDATSERMRIDSAGRIALGDGSANNFAALSVNGTGTLSSMIVPRGTIAERDMITTPQNGMIRYNTNLAKFEVYQNSNWAQLVTGAGAAGDFMANGSVPMTGQFLSVAGTAATPGMAFAGDADTGIWNAGANRLAFSTAGAGRMYIDNVGNVGIGTNAPASSLEVEASNQIINTANVNLAIRSNNSQGADIGGSLGLGGLDGASAGSERIFGVISGRKENSTSGNYSGYLSFATRDNGSAPTERMRISSNGNVGIGTPAPADGAILDLYGTGNLSSMIVPRGTTAQRAVASINGMVRFNTDAQKFEVYEGHWKNMVATGGGGDFLRNGTTSMTGNFNTGLNWISGDGDNEGLYVSSTGAVAINTTGPAADTSLHIYGTDSMIPPIGDDAERPGAPIEGMFRYNSEHRALEVFNSSWHHVIHGRLSGTNMFIGNGVGNGTSGANNTAIGRLSMFGATTAAGNSALGDSALNNVTTGGTNTAVGLSASSQLTTGNDNATFGHLALQANVTGSENVAIGSRAGSTGLSRSGSVYVGARAGENDAGNQNVMIGYRTGQNNTTGDHNILIGAYVEAPLPSGDDQLNIGNLIYGLNLTGTGAAVSPTGQLGIGTQTPMVGAVLDVYATGANSAMIVPRDTSANRPAVGQNGMIRYNTSLAKFEVYENNGWFNMVNSGGGGSYLPIAGGTMTGALTLVSGSDTNPALSFPGAFNAGFTSPSAHRMDIVTSGAYRVTFAPSGNVGIGTTDPTNRLVVDHSANEPTGILALNSNGGGAAAASIAASNGTSQTYVLQSGTGAGGYGVFVSNAPNGLYVSSINPAGELYFETGGENERMRIDSIGRVAIGTTTPAIGAILTLNGTGNLSSMVVPKGTMAERAVAPANGMIRYNTNISKFEVYQFGWTTLATTSSGTGGGGALLQGGNNFGASPVQFGSSVGGTGGVHFMLNGTASSAIDTSGNWGFGILAPTAGAIAEFNGVGSSRSSIIVPRDTAGTRPTAANGMIRYNTNISKFEVVEANNWFTLFTDTKYGGTNSISLGKGTGLNITGSGNTVMGVGTLPVASAAYNNTVYGATSLATLSGGYSNTAVGTNVLNGIGAGYDNTAIGREALQFPNLSSNGNVAVGAGAGRGSPALDFQHNTFIGTRAGMFNDQSANGNVYIGYQTGDYLTMNASNNIAIGYNLRRSPAAISNTMTIGNIIYGMDVSGTGTQVSNVARLGIGTSTPTLGSVLDVVGTGVNFSSIRVPQDTIVNRPSGANGMIRYNTSIGKFEVYENAWSTIATTPATGILPVVSGGTGTNNGSITGTGNLTISSGSGNYNVILNAAGTGVGIGTTSPLANLHVYGTSTATSALPEFIGSKTELVYSPAAAASTPVIGQTTDVSTSAVGASMTSVTMYGQDTSVRHGGTGTLDTAAGLNFVVENGSSGTITNAYGISARVLQTGGSVSNATGVRIWDVQGATAHGVRIEDLTSANAWAFYQEGQNDKNYFAGPTGVGVSPTNNSILDVNGTGALSNMIVPRGLTAARHPNAIAGMVRYNTNLNRFEGYQDNHWQNLSSQMTIVGSGGLLATGDVNLDPAGRELLTYQMSATASTNITCIRTGFVGQKFRLLVRSNAVGVPFTITSSFGSCSAGFSPIITHYVVNGGGSSTLTSDVNSPPSGSSAELVYLDIAAGATTAGWHVVTWNP